MAFSEEARDWLARFMPGDARHLRVVPMKGSSSSSLFLLQEARGRASRQFVLRLLDHAEWLGDEPDLAEHEAAALMEAQVAGLPAPRLVAYAADEVGFGAPVVLMTYIEGEIRLRPPDFPSWLRALAAQLAAIHRHTADSFPWHFRSWVNRAALAPAAWSTAPHLWERAIEFWLSGVPEPRAVFIHRDYHPTNVLWNGGAVCGVVDWINACRGPAGVDVAHCRTNLALMYGTDAADRFLDVYLDAAEGFFHEPYWDIDSLLDMVGCAGPGYYEPWQHFGLGPVKAEELRRRADAYLERVLARV